MTVEQLLNNISAKELQEWQVYDLISPIGEKRLDLNIAHLLHTIYQYLVGDKNTLYTQELALDFEAPFLTQEELEQKQEAIANHKMQVKTKSKLNSANNVLDIFKGMQKK